jgi:predicted RNA binding protein YcfA (HicA-like mRNA interferase family)
LKINEMRRWLAKQGCVFEQLTRHELVSLEGRTALLPRHGNEELRPGTMHDLLKNLGLRYPEGRKRG